jgi:hypothetical protein
MQPSFGHTRLPASSPKSLLWRSPPCRQIPCHCCQHTHARATSVLVCFACYLRDLILQSSLLANQSLACLLPCSFQSCRRLPRLHTTLIHHIITTQQQTDRHINQPCAARQEPPPPPRARSSCGVGSGTGGLFGSQALAVAVDRWPRPRPLAALEAAAAAAAAHPLPTSSSTTTMTSNGAAAC